MELQTDSNLSHRWSKELTGNACQSGANDIRDSARYALLSNPALFIHFRNFSLKQEHAAMSIELSTFKTSFGCKKAKNQR